MPRPAHDDVRCANGRTYDEVCYGCNARSTLVSPAATPTRTNYAKNPPRQWNNWYERGIPTSRRPDGSEMPYLRADGDAMRQVEFNAKRHQIDDNRRRIEATARAA